jgi:chemotaxis protein CheX
VTVAPAPGLDPAVLEEIVNTVVAGMFGEQLDPPYPWPIDEAVPVTGQVRISGGWSGIVEVACSPRLAEQAAQALFLLAGGEIDEADVRDVIGELANVIGGNVKSVLPGPSALSLPATTVGPTEGPTRCAAIGDGLWLDLTWYGQPLRVGVWPIPDPPDTGRSPRS